MCRLVFQTGSETPSRQCHVLSEVLPKSLNSLHPDCPTYEGLLRVVFRIETARQSQNARSTFHQSVKEGGSDTYSEERIQGKRRAHQVSEYLGLIFHVASLSIY
jgi:hypothetical protein